MNTFSLSIASGIMTCVAWVMTVAMPWPMPMWTAVPGALLAALTACSLCVEIREWRQRERRRALERVIRAVRAGLRRKAVRP